MRPRAPFSKTYFSRNCKSIDNYILELYLDAVFLTLHLSNNCFQERKKNICSGMSS